MPAIATNARKFILNTDYGSDKVLATYEGSFSAVQRIAAFQPARSSKFTSHNLGTWCLVNGAFTTDGSRWYPFGLSAADTSGTQPTFQTVEVSAYCTTTQVVVQASNWTTAPATVTYALQLIARD